eukprot:3702736-Rhodomonas_salina.1
MHAAAAEPRRRVAFRDYAVQREVALHQAHCASERARRVVLHARARHIHTRPCSCYTPAAAQHSVPDEVRLGNRQACAPNNEDCTAALAPCDIALACRVADRRGPARAAHSAPAVRGFVPRKLRRDHLEPRTSDSDRTALARAAPVSDAGLRDAEKDWHGRRPAARSLRRQHAPAGPERGAVLELARKERHGRAKDRDSASLAAAGRVPERAARGCHARAGHHGHGPADELGAAALEDARADADARVAMDASASMARAARPRRTLAQRRVPHTVPPRAVQREPAAVGGRARVHQAAVHVQQPSALCAILNRHAPPVPVCRVVRQRRIPHLHHPALAALDRRPRPRGSARRSSPLPQSSSPPRP